MKVLKVKSKWFRESDLRLDAEYHLSDGSTSKRLIEKSPYALSSLTEVTSQVFSGKIFRRIFVDSPKKGFDYVTASDMVKFDISSGKYISRKYTSQKGELEIKPGWILLSCSGTLGNTVFTGQEFTGKIGTHDLIRIVPNSEKIKPGYLYAYLSSKYGYSLLVQSSYGGVVKHIEPHHIENLPVPSMPKAIQTKIHELIIKATEQRYESAKLLEKAEQMFMELNELKYSDKILEASENALQIGFKVKCTDFFNKTIKARNHSYRANRIINDWSKREGMSMKNWVTEEGLTRGTGGFFKRVDDAKINGLDIVSQGDIHEPFPTYKKIIKRGIKESEIARKGMVIMPAAGTLGENEIFLRPLLVYKNIEGKVLSEVVGKLRCKSLEDSAYLYLALKSKPGFRILRSMVYGTNLLYPRWDLLADINIPCKNQSVKRKVANAVIESFELRSDSIINERKAISLIEKEIELWQK